MKNSDIVEVNKDRINYHNKDTRIKIGLHNHGNMLLKHIGIDEQIEEIEERDMATLEGENIKLDFRARLNSGKSLNVEGESDVVRDPALKKTLGYSRELNCTTKKEVISVIIALAEGNNKNVFNGEYCFTFKPFLVEIKKFDGEKYLNICKKKVEDNELFTSDDCGIIDLIPEMKFNRNMSNVIEELCYVIKDGIIPEENRRELTTIINLSIDYYITDKKKRDELTEMLKMDDAFIPEYNRMLRESKKEGKVENIQSIKEEISKNPEITADEIFEILEKKERDLTGK